MSRPDFTLYQLIVTVAPIGIVFANKDGIIELWNPAAEGSRKNLRRVSLWYHQKQLTAGTRGFGLGEGYYSEIHRRKVYAGTHDGAGTPVERNPISQRSEYAPIVEDA